MKHKPLFRVCHVHLMLESLLACPTPVGVPPTSHTIKVPRNSTGCWLRSRGHGTWLPLSNPCAFEHLTHLSSLLVPVPVSPFTHPGVLPSFARDFPSVQAYGEIPVCSLANSWRTQQAPPAIRPSFTSRKRRAAPIDYGAILPGDSKRSSDPV